MELDKEWDAISKEILSVYSKINSINIDIK